jgi:hypothetical protein
MTPRQHLSSLTRSWYGYCVFAALLSVLSLRASGVLGLVFGLGISIALNAVMLLLSIAVVTFLGHKLERRSSLTRVFLVVFSALFTVLGVLGTLGSAWDFLHEWSLASICGIAMMASATMLNARSFRVLTMTAVRAYFV